MRAGTLLNRVRRVEGVLRPRGEIIAIDWHPACQTATEAQDLTLRQLGRSLQPGAIVVLIERDVCPAGAHQHLDQHIIVYPRMD